MKTISRLEFTLKILRELNEARLNKNYELSRQLEEELKEEDIEGNKAKKKLNGS